MMEEDKCIAPSSRPSPADIIPRVQALLDNILSSNEVPCGSEDELVDEIGNLVDEIVQWDLGEDTWTLLAPVVLDVIDTLSRGSLEVGARNDVWVAHGLLDRITVSYGPFNRVDLFLRLTQEPYEDDETAKNILEAFGITDDCVVKLICDLRFGRGLSY
jgi:hypothetical protein